MYKPSGDKMMQDRVEVNQVEYRIIELLGHGKGGYSYLAERDGNFYVLRSGKNSKDY